MIGEISEKVMRSGKILGTTAGSPEAARELMQKGVSYILLSSDQGMMMNWARTAIRAIRETV